MVTNVFLIKGIIKDHLDGDSLEDSLELMKDIYEDDPETLAVVEKFYKDHEGKLDLFLSLLDQMIFKLRTKTRIEE